MTSQSIEVLKHFNEKLITCLPMKDVTFLAKLNSKGLFPGDLKAQVKSQPTSTEAADYFLDNKIMVDLKNDNDESLIQLLSAMEEFDISLKSIAEEIKKKLSEKTSSTESQFLNTTGWSCVINMWFVLQSKFSKSLWNSVLNCQLTLFGAAIIRIEYKNDLE